MFKICEKRTPKAVKRRSSPVDFRLRNPSSPGVVLVIKAQFSLFDLHNGVETNTHFVFAYDFVLALRYLHFFSLLTYIADSTKFLRCLLFTDGRSQLQHSDTSTKPVKRRMLKHQRSSRVDFWWRNPSSPDVVMKALFRILEPQNRVERNTYFVFAHDFVLALRYLHFFPLLTYMTDSTKYIWRLLFTDGRSQLQRYDISTESVKKRISKHWKLCFKYELSSHEIWHCEQKYLLDMVWCHSGLQI